MTDSVQDHCSTPPHLDDLVKGSHDLQIEDDDSTHLRGPLRFFSLHYAKMKISCLSAGTVGSQ